MPEIPQRVSLVAQTKSVLVQGIADGRWRHRLPGERALCAELQISRGTLRSALGILTAQKLVRRRHGQPCQILPEGEGRSRKGKLARVACLTPDTPSRMPPFYLVWIDSLRARLQRLGIQLDLYHGARYYRRDGTRNLRALVEQNPHSAWILTLSTSAMQQWFQARGLPAIVAGSLHSGVSLPSVDNNFRAIGRHAGGMVFGRGHRQVAFLASSLGYGGIGPGTVEIERGVREAFGTTRERECELTAVYHEPNREDICRALDRLLGAPTPPTALIIAHSTSLLTALTHLARKNVAIPRDLSLVVTHDEPFFAHIVPDLSHYEWSPEKFAAQYARLVGLAMEDLLRPDTCIRLMPRFVAGDTLRPPAAA
jgi:DNA-binding LacI/PurR family transcriptional regulator